MLQNALPSDSLCPGFNTVPPARLSCSFRHVWWRISFPVINKGSFVFFKFTYAFSCFFFLKTWLIIVFGFNILIGKCLAFLRNRITTHSDFLFFTYAKKCFRFSLRVRKIFYNFFLLFFGGEPLFNEMTKINFKNFLNLR